MKSKGYKRRELGLALCLTFVACAPSPAYAQAGDFQFYYALKAAGLDSCTVIGGIVEGAANYRDEGKPMEEFLREAEEAPGALKPVLIPIIKGVYALPHIKPEALKKEFEAVCRVRVELLESR